MTYNTLYKIYLFTSLYMTGIIWLIQIIHYPLFKFVEMEHWKSYHKKHIQLTTIVIAGPMILELLSLMLIIYLNNETKNHPFFIIESILLVLIWSTTFFISIPLHNKLSLDFKESDWLALVKTNWIRTFCWSLKSFLLLYEFRINL